MTSLILFIHGLGGDKDKTWGDFPRLLREDQAIAARYRVETFGYPTAKFGWAPPLAECARRLASEIDALYADCIDIVLIGHSQGGLIALRYVADRLLARDPNKAGRVLTIATPHHGAFLAAAVGQTLSDQARDLNPNSEFLENLHRDWNETEAELKVRVKRVHALGDEIVGKVSAGVAIPDSEVVDVTATGWFAPIHRGAARPAAGDTLVAIARRFVLEPAQPPGAPDADFRAPSLRLNLFEGASSRYLYGRRELPFFGRDREMDTLARFAAGGLEPFAWLLLHGPGGGGKSRLALEFCIALQALGWRAGFLISDASQPDWARWQPRLPTLLVIDYAARETDKVGALLGQLSLRRAADGTSPLRYPVRALLIERAGEGDWLTRMLDAGGDKQRRMDTRAKNLPLETMDDLWPVFQHVLGVRAPAREATLAAFAKIDPRRRPLFAFLAADAIADGRDIRKLSAATLLDNVIARARIKFWKDAGGPEERLLALATMAGGLSVKTIKALNEPFLPKWDIDKHPPIFAAMTGQQSGAGVAALEPDIVGEHFVLELLKADNMSDDRERFCALAWKFGPLGMAQFTERAHLDLPGHAMLAALREAPPGREAQLLWAMLGANLIVHLGPVDLAAARALQAKMGEIAQMRDEAALWEQWAKGAVNLIIHLRTSDPMAANALLAELAVVHGLHGRADWPEPIGRGVAWFNADPRNRF